MDGNKLKPNMQTNLKRNWQMPLGYIGYYIYICLKPMLVLYCLHLLEYLFKNTS